MPIIIQFWINSLLIHRVNAFFIHDSLLFAAALNRKLYNAVKVCRMNLFV
jgi:hypothetical protein